MEIIPFQGLANTAVRVQSYWKSKIVTTDPPKYIPHNEYSLVFDLEGDVFFLAVLILKTSRGLRYQRFWRSGANKSLNVSLAFHPNNWKHSDWVHISFFQRLQYKSGGVGLNIRDSPIKQDPRDVVTNWTTNLLSIPTGALIPLTTINSQVSLEASIFLVIKDDTQSTHGRWRIKPSINENLPDSLAFLKQGRCAVSVVTSP